MGLLVSAGFLPPVLDVLSLELLAGIIISPCPDVAYTWCAMTRALGCGCWKCGYCMWCGSGVLCAKLQGVFMEKHKQDEDAKLLQKVSHCSPSVLVMFYAQIFPLAGIWVGCRWFCIGLTLAGGVGC